VVGKIDVAIQSFHTVQEPVLEVVAQVGNLGDSRGTSVDDEVVNSRKTGGGQRHTNDIDELEQVVLDLGNRANHNEVKHLIHQRRFLEQSSQVIHSAATLAQGVHHHPNELKHKPDHREQIFQIPLLLVIAAHSLLPLLAHLSSQHLPRPKAYHLAVLSQLSFCLIYPN